ncbi:MAG: magnesium transporter [Bacillota bacterium]
MNAETDLRQLLKSGNPRDLRRRLSEIHPADVADVIEGIDSSDEIHLLTLMAMLNDRQLAQVLEHLNPSDQLRVIEHMPQSRLQSVVQFVSPDELVDLLSLLDTATVRTLLNVLPDRNTIQELMQYPETSAGGIMTTDFISFTGERQCGTALNVYRRLAKEVDAAYYIYVTDLDGHLTGVITLRELVLAEPTKTLAEIGRSDVVSVRSSEDQEQVSNVLRHYDFLAIPVVDDDHHLLGVITVDDVLDVIEQETSEDIHRMGGVEPSDEPYLQTSAWSFVKRRAVWLLALFAAQTLTGNILDYFQEYIQAVVALAFFIPLLIDTGGNAGAQAASTVIRAMALGEVSLSDLGRVVWREMRSGVVLGAMMAGAAFIQASWIGGSTAIGYTVGGALLIIVILGSMLGACLPLVVSIFRFDPAAASAPVVTTLVDSTGLIVYFMVARWMLGL